MLTNDQFITLIKAKIDVGNILPRQVLVVAFSKAMSGTPSEVAQNPDDFKMNAAQLRYGYNAVRNSWISASASS